RRAFWGSFGGWAMDGFNWTVFGLVLAPTMVALLPRAGIEPTAANIGWYGQISSAIFLLGWGCSAIWGPIADRFGRMPAMTASIVIYGVFTALAGTATNMWEWNGYRFLAAIGVGGEWAMAGTLLAEVLPERVRARFGGAMHSAAYVGVRAVSGGGSSTRLARHVPHRRTTRVGRVRHPPNDPRTGTLAATRRRGAATL